MLHATIKGLLGRKLRLFTTSLAVLLGVAFMAGTLVLTDTIGKTFDDLFADVFAGTDAHVRAEAAFESQFGEEQRSGLDEDLVETVAAVDGVAEVEAFVEGHAQVIGADGDMVGNPNTGAPTYGRNWGENDALNPFDLVEGRAPADEDEVVIDRFTAEEGGYAVGDTAPVVTQAGIVEVEVVGIAAFGETDSPGGTTNVMWTLPAAQAQVGQPGLVDSIDVVAEADVSEDEVRDRIAAVVPDGVEVLTGAEITEETQDAIAEGLSFFNTFLLTFAVIALFVGSFIIYNTFTIIVAQRGREMALMRAIGASRRQVLGSVLAEAVVVGLIASLLGIAAGIGIAAGLKALLAGLGIDIPAGGIVLTADTVVISLITGLVVSVVAALLPARRASKVPPVAAMRDVALDTAGSSRLRIAAGVVILGLGAVALAMGLLGDVDNALAVVGMGAALVIVGVAVLGPVFATPLSRLIGWPLPRLRGVAGTLARENAMRNPRRTSATAAALMIGVSLVGFITILASSTKASIETTIDRAFTGDFVIDSGSFGVGGLPPEVAEQVDGLPEVGAAAALRFVPGKVADATPGLPALTTESLGDIVDLEVSAGSLADLGADGIAVFDEYAEDQGWELGTTVPVEFADTGVQEFTVGAIYGEDELAGNYFVDLAAAEANTSSQFDMQVYVTVADGVEPAEAADAIRGVTDVYPMAELQDRTEFKEAQGAEIDQLVNLIYVLLALAVFIALLGIANTLALSIFERTRELGLLRAVGMTRRQLRSTVRWESVIIALLGTLLGLLIGLFFGWALVTALADEGVNTFLVPVDELVVVTVIAALAGVLAAVVPARRAAKLDVLKAIGSE